MPKLVPVQKEMTQANRNTIVGSDHRHVTPALVEECRLSGLALWPWTANRPEEDRIGLGSLLGIFVSQRDAIRVDRRSSELRFRPL